MTEDPVELGTSVFLMPVAYGGWVTVSGRRVGWFDVVFPLVWAIFAVVGVLAAVYVAGRLEGGRDH